MDGRWWVLDGTAGGGMRGKREKDERLSDELPWLVAREKRLEGSK